MRTVQITKLRVSPPLHASLVNSASDNGRTMNKEIVHRLERSFTGKPRYRVKMGRRVV